MCGTVTVEHWHESIDEAAQIRYHRHYQARDGHRHIHGANLGVSAEAYPHWPAVSKPLTCDEDVQLVRALERSGANIALEPPSASAYQRPSGQSGQGRIR